MTMLQSENRIGSPEAQEVYKCRILPGTGIRDSNPLFISGIVDHWTIPIILDFHAIIAATSALPNSSPIFILGTSR